MVTGLGMALLEGTQLHHWTRRRSPWRAARSGDPSGAQPPSPSGPANSVSVGSSLSRPPNTWIVT
jgi:hypothetical protein